MSSNGNIFRVTGLLCGKFTGERSVTRSFDVFFDLRLNKLLSKRWRGWWLETSLRPLWCHCNLKMCKYKIDDTTTIWYTMSIPLMPVVGPRRTARFHFLWVQEAVSARTSLRYVLCDVMSFCFSRIPKWIITPWPTKILMISGWGNGLLLDHIQPLTEPVLPYHQQYTLEFIPGLWLRGYSRYQSTSCVWHLYILKSQPHLGMGMGVACVWGWGRVGWVNWIKQLQMVWVVNEKAPAYTSWYHIWYHYVLRCWNKYNTRTNLPEI